MKKEFYKRNLPHYQTRGQLFFVTWILADSLPSKVLLRMREELNSGEAIETGWKRNFKLIDELLHKSVSNRYLLSRPELANIVGASIKYWDKKRIDLFCYCCMPNHVHVVFALNEKNENNEYLYLQDILESVKKFSARKCNVILNRSGRFWQHESYDRIIRDREELYYVINYVLENPVCAGLCRKRSEWKWSYVKPEFCDLMEDPVND